MLTKIKVKNYKGFKEAEIPIKPITILLGANSSGKSSMLQLLLLLQQTAEEATESYKSALKIFGNRISIGKPENLFYGLNRKKPICIQIDLSNETLKERLTDAFTTFVFDICYDYLGSDYVDSFFSQDRNKVVQALNEGLQRLEKRGRRYGISSFFVSKYDLHNKDAEAIMRNYDFLTNLYQNIKSSFFSVSYTISYFRKELVISAFTIHNENLAILSFDENNGFSSGLTNLNENDNSLLKAAFSKNSTVFNLFNKKRFLDEDNTNRINTSIVKTIISITNNVLSELQKEFKEPCINHVSPLRAHPQRYYMLDKANISYSLDTYDANAIAEVIKEKTTIKDRVNDWFKKFGLKVDVDEFKEAIHKLTVQQSGLPLDIPDVGFGVSQVLPVVLQGFLSPNKSITIVEQPEVHLHPKMQAALSDLFIDITKESKFTKSLIIETHSEYLLKRLRRRMAEGENITPDKVSINLFHSRTEKTSATIENLPIENRGAFKWPEEYFDDELYDDVVKFLELQGDGDIHINN